MHEGNWKSWVVITLLMVGLTFEVLKHLPAHQSVSWDTENLHFTTGKPYSLREAAHPVRPSRPAFAHVAGDSAVLKEALEKYKAVNEPTQGEFKDKKAKAKKKKDDDEWEEVIDPVTGKKIKRKKKKDAKKDEKKKTEVAVTPELPKINPVPPEDPVAAIGAAVADAAKTGQLPNLPRTNSGGFGTLEDWERRLLSRPDLAETNTFIREYQEHLVTSDTFYAITEKMLQDPRPEMKQLGILCASSTPSVQSFELLAGVQKAGGSNAQLATKALNQYGQQLSYLTYLQNVLHGGDAYSETVALQEIDASAHKFLVPGGGPTPNPSPQGGSGNAARFQPVLVILAQLQNSPNSALANQARQTLADIQSLMGGSAIASAQ
jgi:hypothetical protein